MKFKLGDEEEASFNSSINTQKNLFLLIKKIFPEKINYINNNYIGKTELNFSQVLNNNTTKEENEGQMENFQSSSKSLSKLYFINTNKTNDSIKKEEEEKFLNRKRKRVLIFYYKKISKENKNKLCKKYNFGRKSKEDKNIRKHNCSSKDNIINKIKTHFFHYIRDIIKKNSIYETINIIKFRREFVANLKKDKNIDLLETKLVDILKNQQISTKNKKSNEYQNRIIIDKIYEEKKENRIIQILELTFKELFIIFRKKLNKYEDIQELKIISKKIKELDLITNDDYDDIDYLIKDIKKKNTKNNKMTEEELDIYIKKVLMACLNYEKWFHKNNCRIKKN